MANNIPNRIKQPAQCCVYCGKSYVKKTNLNNHVIVCELLHKSSKSVNIEEEDSIPSQRKMYQMILELSKKINGMDEKIDEINKWVVKKKKKINVIEWLNSNITPEFKFDNLTDKISILEDDIKNLLDNSFNDVLNEIFSRTIYNSKLEQPISSFIQKSNVFYIYENEDAGWIEMSREMLIKFLDKVYMKISRVFSEWKKNNSSKIEDDEKFQLLCDKTSVKLYSVDFKQESTLGKIRTCMYNRMKKDIKGLVEYEFEF
jgi:hypothetical protein